MQAATVEQTFQGKGGGNASGVEKGVFRLPVALQAVRQRVCLEVRTVESGAGDHRVVVGNGDVLKKECIESQYVDFRYADLSVKLVKEA